MYTVKKFKHVSEKTIVQNSVEFETSKLGWIYNIGKFYTQLKKKEIGRKNNNLLSI